MAGVRVEHHSDPGCPWAWSASPALAVLQWRFGEQLEWRHVMIGLTEEAEQYVRRGYTPLRQVTGYSRFRRFGMPFSPQPKPRIAATSPACRAVVAVRLSAPEREWAAFRALQFAQFNSATLLDEPADVHRALCGVPGIDADALVAAIDSPAVREAYEEDRALARSAAGTPTEAQGKSASTDGPVRYTAPSLVFHAQDGRTLEAGGFQHVDAYDVVLANLAPELERRPPAQDVREVLDAFPDGLTTAEVAAVMTRSLAVPDRTATEAALLEAVVDGAAQRTPVGDDAVWQPRRVAALRLAA
jgi:protein-disulfide isomerase-like protein with CxxC motif